MPVDSLCPTPQFLEQLLLGLLPDVEAERIEQHLLDCPTCQATVSLLPWDDTLAEAVQGHAAAKAEIDRYRPEIEALVARISASFYAAAETSTAPPIGEEPTSLPQGASVGGELEGELAFLAHPLKVGDLGRLGAYRVLRMLGAGGMGLVFEGEDPFLQRRVALKVMKPSLAATASFRQRFLREARAAAAAEHDHIVAIYQVGEECGVPFIAMPLLHGETLADRFKSASEVSTPCQRTGLPLADVLRIGREIAEGLAAAHEHGLIHRDVKPSNVWLESGGDRVKLLDFGLARATAGERAAAADDEQLTRVGALMGTPAYMAPEQARGEAVDERADLFSLGCVLYQAATGVSPFVRRDVVSTLLAVAGYEPPPPKDAAPHLPGALNEFIIALLKKEPAARLQSAREVAARLRDLEHEGDAESCESLASIEFDPDRPVPARSPAGSGSGRAPGGLWRWMASGAAAVLLLGVIIIVKMQDGSTRRIEIPGDVRDVTISHTEHDAVVPSENNPDREAVKWVYDAGGQVAALRGEELAWPKQWLEKPSDLPADFDNLMILLAGCQKVTDADLKRIASLTKPFWLNLYRTRITDAGLANLQGSPRLRTLILDSTEITSAGIKNLGALPNLDAIHLHGTQVTGPDLKLLSQFPKLVFVQLGRDQLTSEGIEALANQKNITSIETAEGVGLDEFRRIGKVAQLRHLAAVGKSCSDECLEPLSKLTNLTALALYGASVTDAGIARLSAVAPKLTVVTVSEGRVTDAAMKHLAALSKLEAVNLYQTQVTAAGVAELQAMSPNCRITWTDSANTPRSSLDQDRELANWVLDSGGKLQVVENDAWGAGTAIRRTSELPDSYYGLKVDLADCQALIDADLKRFRSLAKPFSLTVARTRITDAGLAELKGLSNLRRLSVGGTAVTRAGLENLGDLSNLSEIDLIAASTTDEDLSLLSRFPKLKILSIGRAQLTQRGVQALSAQPNIVQLYCDGLGEAESELIGKLSQLQTLSLGSGQFGDACLAPLAQLPNLIALGFHNTSLTDKGVARLPEVAPRLLSLVVSGAPIGDAGLEKLSALPALANLWLNEVNVTDAGLKQLKLLPKLKQLGLNGCHIGDEGLEDLGSLVGLEALHLSGTDITDKGLPHLHRLTNLKLLELTRTRISDAAAADLKAALPGCEIQR